MPTTASSVGIQYTLHDGGGRESSSPPLVLLHGAGGQHLFWPPQIRRLPGRRVYALDLPGHGESTSPAQSTVGGYAGQLLDWMRAVELRRAVLVGHSMGAAVALTMALRSEAVTALVLLGAGASLPVHPELLQLTESRDTFPTAVERIVRGSFSRATDQRFVDLAHQRMLASDPSAFHMDFVACNHFDVQNQLKQIRCPALVVCGADDRMTSPAQNRALAEGLLQAELVIVPDAGHMVMLEQPEAVAGRMAEFVSNLADEAGGEL